MRLEHIVSLAVSQMFGRLIRRAAVYAVAAVFVLAVIYELSAAGTVALSDIYGPVYARLIVAGIDAVIVLLLATILFATRARSTPAGIAASAPLKGLTDARIAMLIESAMLGYSLGRNKQR
ncbi:MAG: hypothetical protein OJF62_003261 [Pseudolabrys sp.]|jgi:hypothetical protein|nr:hypothetical protein [Pseudolabrys sp.]